ncbi:cytidylate kinase [Breznakia sp. PF5-3]|uniref:(d)CMP kinase n=1 Tax=unclassified Breznakia TaxID=2623764 RepID=UPI002406073A|nr:MULTISPECIES: (d)CMP kinase [unclassified Breznakia]MDF9823922.1 cytidylate kinase [Breznakia sp. PM6-1]MDF9834721.1 cytidylate kinase [Breznakia sp. PF5-3]MDF9836844.1 cytidylate kinase [Breznakia sp. PFB2-8]MDF9858861.1 cytidylate kinase [Breznakia sp. PH5-24]
MINIAIDGPSAAGKSTIAKLLAKKLKYVHLDTGAMYRCCAYASLYYGIDLNDTKRLEDMMNEITISFSNEGHILLNEIDVNDKIRTNEISMRTSSIAQLPFVREKLVHIQQNIAQSKGFVLDGRDIGTVVLPDADIKIFLVASVEARAKRRYQEYENQNIDVDYEDIYKDIEKRDFQDINRKISPLKKADDAVEIDTSTLSIQQVLDKILEVIKKKEKE